MSQRQHVLSSPMRRVIRRIAAAMVCSFTVGWIAAPAAEQRNGSRELRVIQPDDFHWLVGKWDIVASESTAPGPEFPMASFRVYKPYCEPEDLDITNVTNRCIAAEFLRPDGPANHDQRTYWPVRRIGDKMLQIATRRMNGSPSPHRMGRGTG
jgi:hypothetical protein